MKTKTDLRILHLEDVPADVELVERQLRHTGHPLILRHAASREEFVRALDEFHPDVVLADYSLPHFDGLAAVRLARETDPDLPIIVVTGILGDEAAVDVIKAGANDYVLKDRLARLGSAVERAVEEGEQSRARKRAEAQIRTLNAELEQQNRRLEAASRMKSEFLANMSHELRSPLNGIIGFTELVYDGKVGPLPERAREFLGRIHSSARFLLYLINGILDLSKVEAGLLVFDPQPTSVSGIIQEVTGILGALAAQKQISIRTEIEAGADSVIIDPGRLKQILYNYLSNAVKFTGSGGHVVVRSKNHGAAEFRLEVSDTGVGIAEEDFPRLFVEFQQLDTTKSKRYQGTGLGLALTKHLAEAQGGRVGVESRVGKGSTFFVVLPRAPIPAHAELPCPGPDPGATRSAEERKLVPHA